MSNYIRNLHSNAQTMNTRYMFLIIHTSEIEKCDLSIDFERT